MLVTGRGDPKIKCQSCGRMVILRDHVRLVAGVRWLDCPECGAVNELVLQAPAPDGAPTEIDLREAPAHSED